MCYPNRKDPELVARDVGEIVKAAGHCPAQAAMTMIRVVTTQCQLVEQRKDEGEMAFFRDQVGRALEEAAIAVRSGDVERAAQAFDLADRGKPDRVM